MTPETAPAVSEFAAGNGAPRLGKGPADEDAPASDPADVGGDESRADVALLVVEDFDDALGHPCGCDAHNEIRRQLQDPAFAAAWAQLRERQGVVRTLDVAEATADKARGVGLARETTS